MYSTMPFCPVTYGDHIREALHFIDFYGLRFVARNVYAYFLHDLNRQGVHCRGVGSRTESLKLAPTQVIEKPLGHLAAT